MGSWRKEEILGNGSYGTVRKAVRLPRELADSNDDDDDTQSIMASQIAVKSADSSSSETSLKEEGRILLSLRNCPGIVYCYGENTSYEHGKRVYSLLLEYAPGGSLEKLIERRGGALPESEVRRYTRMILKTLKYVHKMGYVHCDIKPHNILVFPSQDGNRNCVKIADFGLAKKADEGNGWSHFRGTLLYASPESIGWNMNKSPADIWALGCTSIDWNMNKKSPADIWALGCTSIDSNMNKSPADIWALGCTVSQMMTGRPPWECTDGAELRKIIPGAELPRIPENMSSQGKDFLRKCFERDWKTRSTAAELLGHPFVQGEPDEWAEMLPSDAPWVSSRSMFK